jgi:hypothetical protein
MRHTVTVFGVVHPEAGNWWLHAPDWKTTAFDGSEIDVTLAASAYSMTIKTEGPDDIEASIADGSFLTWLNEVIYGHQPYLRLLLDSLGLHLGATLEPEMKGGTVQGVAIINSMTAMSAYGTVGGASSVGGATLVPTAAIAMTNPFARFALADVRHALRFDLDCPFFCYRALDSLRQHYAATTGAKSEKASWEALRTDLGIQLADIKALKQFADTRRHGGAGTSLHADHTHWTGWTREVVARFITKYGPPLLNPPGQ